MNEQRAGHAHTSCVWVNCKQCVWRRQRWQLIQFHSYAILHKFFVVVFLLFVFRSFVSPSKWIDSVYWQPISPFIRISLSLMNFIIWLRTKNIYLSQFLIKPMFCIKRISFVLMMMRRICFDDGIFLLLLLLHSSFLLLFQPAAPFDAPCLDVECEKKTDCN